MFLGSSGGGGFFGGRSSSLGGVRDGGGGGRGGGWVKQFMVIGEGDGYVDVLRFGLRGMLLIFPDMKASSRAFERLLVVDDIVMLGFAVKELATLI